jgi:sulfur carrier protein ThiS
MHSNDLSEDEVFVEFRRKVRESELLSSSMQRLLAQLHFSGRLMVVVKNGRVLKSGYEEGYFSRRNEVPLLT